MRGFLALCLLVVASATAWAHPSHWLVATAEIRRDATFDVELILDREFTPNHFGEKAPHVEVVGLPEARHLADAVAGLTGLLQPRRGRPMGAAGEDTQGRHKSGTRKRETGMDVHVDPSACRTR